MTKAFFLSVLAMGTLHLAACGKTDDDKKLDQAVNLAERYVTDEKQINAKGTPSFKWTDEELDSYEALVSDIDSVNQAMLQNSHDNIMTSDGSTTEYVLRVRSQLKIARAVKIASNGSASKADLIDKIVSLEIDGVALDQGLQQQALILKQDDNNVATLKKIDGLSEVSLANIDARLAILSNAEFNGDKKADKAKAELKEKRHKISDAVLVIKRRLYESATS